MTKKTLIRFGLFFGILAISVPLPAQEPWSLEDCINHALEQNIQIKQQKLGVEVAKENLSQSRANRFPTFNANASHNYSYGRSIDPFTNEFVTETVRSNSFGVSSGVTLFSGFQIWNTIRQGEIDLRASTYDVEAMQNDISMAVASAYLQILFNKELLEIARSQLEITRQQVDRTARLVEAGSLARGSLLNIEAQAATEEMQLVDAENRLEIAYLDLVQLLDLEEVEGFEIEVPEIAILPDDELDKSPMQIYAEAVNLQPDVRSSELRVASAEKEVKIAKGGRSPMLRMSGSYGTGYSEGSLEPVATGEFDDPQLIGATESGEPVFGLPRPVIDTRVVPFSDQLNENLSRSIGFQLTIPIFNNYQTRANIGRSRIALENAKLSNQLVRDQLFKTIQQAHADAKGALKRYIATEKNVVALEESFRYTEQRFNVGMVNTLEYNDAKTRLSQAQSDLLQAKYEFVFRVKILDFYLGKPLTI